MGSLHRLSWPGADRASRFPRDERNPAAPVKYPEPKVTVVPASLGQPQKVRRQGSEWGLTPRPRRLGQGVPATPCPGTCRTTVGSRLRACSLCSHFAWKRELGLQQGEGGASACRTASWGSRPSVRAQKPIRWMPQRGACLHTSASGCLTWTPPPAPSCPPEPRPGHKTLPIHRAVRPAHLLNAIGSGSSHSFLLVPKASPSCRHRRSLCWGP